MGRPSGLGVATWPSSVRLRVGPGLSDGEEGARNGERLKKGTPVLPPSPPPPHFLLPAE